MGFKGVQWIPMAKKLSINGVFNQLKLHSCRRSCLLVVNTSRFGTKSIHARKLIASAPLCE